MFNAVIGNIFSFCAMITDSISGTREKRNEILAVQTLSQMFYGASTLVLKGYSGTVQNVVAILRNIAAMKNINNKLIEWSLILLGVVFGIVFNNLALIGWLPIIANLEYSIAVFRFKDKETLLKIAFVVNTVMFIIFSFAIKNYVATIGNIVVAVTTTISLIKGKEKGISAAGKRTGCIVQNPIEKDRVLILRFLGSF